MSDLAQKTCAPCQGGIPPIAGEALKPWLAQIDPSWEVIKDETKITRTLDFKTFKENIAFVNQIAEIAEQEKHHPDLYIFYNTLKIELWTHKINGLYDNDFILAAKIDELWNNQKTAS